MYKKDKNGNNKNDTIKWQWQHILHGIPSGMLFFIKFINIPIIPFIIRIYYGFCEIIILNYNVKEI